MKISLPTTILLSGTALATPLALKPDIKARQNTNNVCPDPDHPYPLCCLHMPTWPPVYYCTQPADVSNSNAFFNSCARTAAACCELNITSQQRGCVAPPTP
ncbi:hypothetical protein BDW74DRAFT_179177 [Aspergillus multicolor]|uniref:uncharacterized protein n=1 Tax=Aspergillus multicolor TaxID=41759 RepID=UPI003CCCF84F